MMTVRTVAAQTAMSKGRNICHCDFLSRQDSRKDQIKYSYFGLEAEGNDENVGGQRSDSVKKGSDVTASETVTENE